jgi:Tfp pilus assembly ATPase PilU
MQAFDQELEKLARAGTISISTALGYSTNQGNLRLTLSDLIEEENGPALTPSGSSNLQEAGQIQ